MFNEMGLVKFSHHTLNYIVELLDGSLICAIMHQRWKEEPRGGDYHKRHRNGPTQGPMQSPFSAQPLHRTKLRNGTHPMEQKEARDLPRGTNTCDVVENQLVH